MNKGSIWKIKIQVLLLCSKLCYNLPMHVQSREEEGGRDKEKL